MKEILVENIKPPYTVYLDNNLDKLSSVMLQNKIATNSKVLIITDNNIVNLYPSLLKVFKESYQYKELLLNTEDMVDEFESIHSIYDFMFYSEMDKDSIVIVIGGSKLINLAGFCTATYMGGLGLIIFPTTVLSQANNSIMGKFSFAFNEVEDLIFIRYTPLFVFNAINFLHTCDENSFKLGMIKFITTGLMHDKSLFNFICENCKHIVELENDKLLYVIKENIRSAQDFLNKKSSEKLSFDLIDNILKVYDNKISPINIQVINILLIAKLSHRKLNFHEEYLSQIRELLIRIGFSMRDIVDILIKLLYSIKHDKKLPKIVKLVLLEEIGTYRENVSIETKDIIEAIEEVIKEGK